MNISNICKSIKIVLSDVDGVLTDGRLYFSSTGETMKVFHALDGVGIKLLKKKGLQFGIITARNSPVTAARMQELDVDIVHQNIKDKLTCCTNLIKEYGFKLSEVAYIGDDLPDLPLLKQVGLSATVPHALPAISKHCHYITSAPAGFGAFREFAQLILDKTNE